MKEHYNFTLPNGKGFSAELGNKIKGSMRLAKVKDFMAIQKDTRMKDNKSFFYISLLSRVIEKLGTERMITNATIGKLSGEDFTFLVDLFNQINHESVQEYEIQCECGRTFRGGLNLPGEA